MGYFLQINFLYYCRDGCNRDSGDFIHNLKCSANTEPRSRMFYFVINLFLGTEYKKS